MHARYKNPNWRLPVPRMRRTPITLTKACVDNLPPPVSQVQNRKGSYEIYPVAGLPGAGLKVTETGLKHSGSSAAGAAGFAGDDWQIRP